MRSTALLAVAILAVVLALSSAQNAFSGTWITYDDGTPEHEDLNLLGCIAVRFSAPPGSELLRVAYYRMHTVETAFNIYILGSDGQTVLFGPQSTNAVGPEGWFYVDVNIIVSGAFYTAACWPVPDPLLGVDADNSGQTFTGTIGSWAPYTYASTPANLMIRAELGSSTPVGPVGGVVESVNKVAIFAPYLALFGVIGAVAIVVWKRPDH
jgi:hypothetical protein